MDDFHYIIQKLTKGNIDLKTDTQPLLSTVITYTKVCRLCLKENCLRSASDTFEGDLKNFDIIWTLLGIIIPNELQIMICESCLDVLSLFHKYRRKCKTNNRAMLKLEEYLNEITENKTDTVSEQCENSIGDPLEAFSSDLQPVPDNEDLIIEIKPEPIEMETDAVIESSVTVPDKIVKEELQVKLENTEQFPNKYISPKMFRTHIQCPACQLHMLRSNFKRHLTVHVLEYEYKQKVTAESVSVDLNVETKDDKSEIILLQPNSTEESEDIGLFVIDRQSFKKYKNCLNCGGYVHISQFGRHIALHAPACKIKSVEHMTSNADPKATTKDQEPSEISVIDREYFNEYVSCILCQNYMHYHFINRHMATHMPGYKGRQAVIKHQIIDQALINSAGNEISKTTGLEKNELQNVQKQHKKPKIEHTFNCSICPYRSMVRTNLEKHVQSKHLQSAYEYRCSACPYRSKIRYNIKRHVKTRHAPNVKNTSIASESPVSLQAQVNIKADQKVSIIKDGLDGTCIYYCSACLYHCSVLSSMKTHIEAVHEIGIPEKSSNSTTVSTKHNTQTTVAVEQQINSECSLNITETTIKSPEPGMLIDKHMDERHNTESMDDKSVSNDNDITNAVNEVRNENREEEEEENI